MGAEDGSSVLRRVHRGYLRLSGQAPDTEAAELILLERDLSRVRGLSPELATQASVVRHVDTLRVLQSSLRFRVQNLLGTELPIAFSHLEALAGAIETSSSQRAEAETLYKNGSTDVARALAAEAMRMHEKAIEVRTKNAAALIGKLRALISIYEELERMLDSHQEGLTGTHKQIEEIREGQRLLERAQRDLSNAHLEGEELQKLDQRVRDQIPELAAHVQALADQYLESLDYTRTLFGERVASQLKQLDPMDAALAQHVQVRQLKDRLTGIEQRGLPEAIAQISADQVPRETLALRAKIEDILDGDLDTLRTAQPTPPTKALAPGLSKLTKEPISATDILDRIDEIPTENNTLSKEHCEMLTQALGSPYSLPEAQVNQLVALLTSVKLFKGDARAEGIALAKALQASPLPNEDMRALYHYAYAPYSEYLRRRW